MGFPDIPEILIAAGIVALIVWAVYNHLPAAHRHG